jgi:hypothetical protein
MARDRDFDLAGGKPMNTRKSLLALSLMAGCFVANDAMAQYAPVGVQQDVPEATVIAGGWTPCYSETFGDSGTSLATIQADCDKANLMMACRPVGDSDYSLLAQAPRADVFFFTDQSNTPHDANGVGWYYSDNFSWGFAPEGEPINRDNCDYDEGSQTQADMRMCIHTNGGATDGGYRCGDNDLNADSSWERVLLEADDPPPGVRFGDAGLNAPVLVAEEAVIPPSRTLSNVDNALDLITNVDYAFSPGEVRYARLDCPGIVFDDTTTVSFSGDASNTIGAVNGVGSSAIYFSITAGANPVLAVDQITIGGDRGISAAQATDCTYGLYDFPSEAQAGGTDGRVATASGGYLRFGPSYGVVVDSQGLATADVESEEPPFSAFTDDSPTGDPALAQLGGFTAGTIEDISGDTQPIGLDGMPIELEDLLDDDTALVFAGDFSAADFVFLAPDADCSGGFFPADSFDDSAAVFTVGSEGGSAFLCFVAGGEAIAAGDFSVAVDAVPLDPDTYNAPDIAAQAIGSIVHNGTELQAPLAQVPGAGWLSRLVLTNTGSVDRPYQISVMGETGNTIGTSNTTGVVPANGTVVVDLTTVMTSFSAGQQRRGTLNVTVAAPTSQIQGLYQIVNTNSGSLSNHVMVRPVVEDEGRP